MNLQPLTCLACHILANLDKLPKSRKQHRSSSIEIVEENTKGQPPTTKIFIQSKFNLDVEGGRIKRIA